MSKKKVACEKWVEERPENTTLGDVNAEDDGGGLGLAGEKLPDLFTGVGIQTKWQQFAD